MSNFWNGIPSSANEDVTGDIDASASVNILPIVVEEAEKLNCFHPINIDSNVSYNGSFKDPEDESAKPEYHKIYKIIVDNSKDSGGGLFGTINNSQGEVEVFIKNLA